MKQAERAKLRRYAEQLRKAAAASRRTMLNGVYLEPSEVEDIAHILDKLSDSPEQGS